MTATRSSGVKSVPGLKQATISDTSYKPSTTSSSPCSTKARRELKSDKTSKVTKLSKKKLGTTASSSVAEERVETDVLMSIYPIHLANIASQRKNHEYRNYRLRDGVERLWFYETKGTKQDKGRAAITHIATIPSNVRRPQGTVPEEPVGIGNVDFNAGLMASKFGYPIIELYELVEPIPLEKMKKEWGMGGAPMGWSYVKKNMWQARWGEDDESREDKVTRVF
ncbi:hypothetical protein B0J13DRAFT_504335 [Dactylonectria estremocensis]|uniref:Uncharacterized protein n=1 Tax=Dactylonectria estremocensis TaxID=1079267 RepID=A0A9P9EIN0_9HYPO|nr:hypothetical protein B0J13DRAFT_504335 [Dactylonectria estremocensis]